MKKQLIRHTYYITILKDFRTSHIKIFHKSTKQTHGHMRLLVSIIPGSGVVKLAAGLNAEVPLSLVDAIATEYIVAGLSPLSWKNLLSPSSTVTVNESPSAVVYCTVNALTVPPGWIHDITAEVCVMSDASGETYIGCGVAEKRRL